MRKPKKERTLGPVFTIMLLSLVIAVSSLILSLIGFEGQLTSINNDTLESTMILINNFISKDGINYLFGNIVNILGAFEPIALTIISLIGIGIAERSGLFKILFRNVKYLNPRTVTFITFLVSIAASFFGDFAFVVVIPIAAIFYKYANRNARLGVLTAFIATCVGYGTGIMFNNIDLLLGMSTQASASLDVDKSYVYNISSSLYLMLGSTVILASLGSIIVDTFLANKFPKKTPLQDEELHVSKKGLILSGIAFLLMTLVIIYSLIPNLPGSGALLDMSQEGYVNQLLSDNAPFYTNAVFLFTVMMMICGMIYGKVSGNIKSSNEYSLALSTGFDGIGYLFVLFFFSSLLLAIVDYTNIGTVISANLVSFIGSMQFSGIPLIISLFVIVIIIGLFIPSTVTKWNLLNPVVVPLFMRSNIAPDFTQFVFRAADGVAKAITPIFPYYMVMLAYLEKYNYDEENKITIFGVWKLIFPVVLMLIVVWILILIGWYVIGLPMGNGTYVAL